MYVLAYYAPQDKPGQDVALYFNKLGRVAQGLEKEGHRVVMMGDSNGDRDEQGEPKTDDKGKENVAAAALQRAENEAGHRWLRPQGAGPLRTRYTARVKQLEENPGFDPAHATSAIDHASIGTRASQQCTVQSYRLHNERHYGADHAGLLMTLNIEQSSEAALKMIPTPPKRTRLGKDKAVDARYGKETLKTLGEWKKRTEDNIERFKSNRGDRQRRETKKLIDEAGEGMRKALIQATITAQIPTTKPKREKERTTRRKAKKRKQPEEATAGRDIKTRRNAWTELLRENKKELEQTIREERKQWERETNNIEEKLKQGDWNALWGRHKRRKMRSSAMLPLSFTNAEGDHIWKKRKVLDHIANEAHAIAEPEHEDYLTPTCPKFTTKIHEEVRKMKQRTKTKQTWYPTKKDVTTMFAYFRRAYTRKTCAGPDDLSADLFLYADIILRDCLLLLLQVMAMTGEAPAGWAQMDIILAYKEGRDAQNLRKGYRPICIGSLLMKATERIFQGWYEEKREKRPQHPAIMAYRKGIGHDMAMFAVTEAALHAKYRNKGEKEARLYAICIDIENAFNGTWRELVEWIEWTQLGLRGTQWSLARSISGDRTYRVKVHGQKTRRFTQRYGYGQGPGLSPGKYNTSTHPLLKALERAGAGVEVGEDHVLGIAWSDDLFMLVTEDKLDKVLRALETYTGRLRKKTNAKKVFITPLCNKLPNKERPVAKLGKKILPYKTGEKMLGFTIGQSIQGTLTYGPNYRSKTKNAVAKLETMGIHNRQTIRPIQTKKYYQSTVESVITANLTLPQLDTARGNMHGYEEARKTTAAVLRRMMATSGRTTPIGIIAEAGWDLPDRAIIQTKMRLMARLIQRKWDSEDANSKREEEYKQEEIQTLVLTQRIKDTEEGDTTGFCAEIKRLWQEAGQPDNWPPTATETYKKDIQEEIKGAAEAIADARLRQGIEEMTEENGDTPYGRLYQRGETWRILNGTKRQSGIMTSARLGALMTGGGRTADNMGVDPGCICCGRHDDTGQHILLKCRQMKEPRQEMHEKLKKLWSEDQWRQYRHKSQHERYITLLSQRYLTPELDRNQKIATDLAVKEAFQQMDDIRIQEYNLQPLNGKLYSRPPEGTLEQAAAWNRDEEERQERIRQGGKDTEERAYQYDTETDDDSDKTEDEEEGAQE